MARTKVTPKRVRIRRWPPKQPSAKFKIKTIMPEQKTVNIKKNGQVVRTIKVRIQLDSRIGGPDNFKMYINLFAHYI